LLVIYSEYNFIKIIIIVLHIGAGKFYLRNGKKVYTINIFFAIIINS